MGEGDEDLGRLLTGNFIKALKDLDHLPAKIVFYNKGVMLGRVGSPYESDLSELEKMGVTLLFCATCIDHYTIRDQVRIGHFSNMFEIAQTMASASHVIKP
jgi:selenium metabolism protein YedF